MKIILIRHAEPNYEIDGLTEKGKIEARLLADRLVKEKIDYFYSSPLGRARLTIAPTLDKLGREAEYLPWLREFSYPKISLPYKEETICWDLLPEFANENPALYTHEWASCDFIKNSDVYKEYENVTAEFDKLIEKHGYKRDGLIYRAEKPNRDTIVITCHFGIISILLSHIMHTSPFSLWQNSCALPSSVTTIYTEERRNGIAQLRAVGIGDVSHLYAVGEEPSFSARFCECFDDGTRHD